VRLVLYTQILPESLSLVSGWRKEISMDCAGARIAVLGAAGYTSTV
jgi:hypothetical protein